MKQLTLIYDTAIESSLDELLDALEIPGITWIRDVPGRGGRGAKMNTPVFPGSNSIAIIVLPDEEVGRVHRAVRRLQESFRLKPGVTILSQDVDVLP